MKNIKSMAVNAIAQCIFYISVTIFSVTNIIGKALPNVGFIIIMVLDLLTILAFMYAYVRNLKNDNNRIIAYT